MNEWDVLQVIIVIAGMFVTVGKPVLNFTKTVTEMLAELKALKEKDRDHDRELEEHEAKLQDHEIRIHDLEQ